MLFVSLISFVIFSSGCVDSGASINQNSPPLDTSSENDLVPTEQGESVQKNSGLIDEQVSTPGIKEFTITAESWKFSPSTITVNEGDTVKLHIKSIDISHGFGLPEFGITERLEPGVIVDVEFVADKKGTFTFSCTVFCGIGHSGMNGQLIVE